MRLSRSSLLYAPLAAALALAAVGCSGAGGGGNQTAGANVGASPSPGAQTLTRVDPPASVTEQKAAREDLRDDTRPVLEIVAPADGSTVQGPDVAVRLELGGNELHGYKTGKDPATMVNNDPSTMKGNHIHVILDNEPYEAYYNLGEPFVLRNLSEGRHTLRVFASRPWHESYKNEGSFQMAVFTVRGGGDPNRPTTTNTGQVMADNRAADANANAAPAATPEGKDYAGKPNAAGEVDKTKPLLTYSRPKGEYKGADADPVMIDFWLTNVKLEGDGGEYRVRYTVDGGPPAHLTKWEPVWLKGWAAGKHRVKLELVDRNDDLVQNGGFNSTEREITITK